MSFLTLPPGLSKHVCQETSLAIKKHKPPPFRRGKKRKEKKKKEEHMHVQIMQLEADNKGQEHNYNARGR